MKPQAWLVGIGLTLWALPVHAAELDLGGALLAELEPAAGWTITREPPPALIEEIAEHLDHEARSQGRQPGREQLLAAARAQLAANEVFVVHSSGAHLDCDASPLDAGVAAPDAETLQRSAEYAASSLEGEEGVGAYRHRIGLAALAGVKHAVRLDADYRLHEAPRKFVGIITFAAGHWLFFYYTDPLKDPRAFPEMEAMLAGLRIREKGR